MAIVESEIKQYLSGGATNTDKNASIGGAISSTEIVNNTLNNLFDLATSAESSAGSTRYRAFYIKNTNATNTYYSSFVYISSNTSSATTTVEIGLATEDGSPIETLANDTTAPSGVTFSTAAGEANKLDIGDLAPDESKAVWVKWTITAGTEAINDEMTLSIKGETAA